MRKRRLRGSFGFTLIEMMVVISVMLILLAVATPIYTQSVRRAREDALHKNLETLNKVIYQYTLDKQRAPQSLEDLVQAGYLKSVPEDITGRNDTWQIDQEEDIIMLLEQTQTGIVGVHSGSDQTASDGTAYSSW